MAQFRYIGTTKDGNKVTEIVEAADKYAVYDVARGNGHIVLNVVAVNKIAIKSFFNMEKINSAISRIKQDELVMFTRNLSSMIKAGLALSRALSVIERQTKNPKMKTTIAQIRETIDKGESFHVALKAFPKVFSQLYIAMVRAGEESGGLVNTLQTISLQLERSSSLKKKIKGAMIYPAIVISVMVIIGVLMMIFVVPTLTDTFTKMNIELPLTTRIIIGTSTLFSNHMILVLGALIGFIVGMVAFARSRFGKRIIHFTIIRLPVIGQIVKQTNSAYTARTLSSLLSSGVDVIGAIKITEDVLQNVYYKEVLKKAAVHVEKGSPLSEIFIAHEKLYPILVGEMVSVGEETGQISQMLTELAIFYETEVEQKTKDLSTIIEPILMVTIGGGVGFFALAMIAPIYSISDSIN